MRNYPIDKYSFEIKQNEKYLTTEIVASSTYAGQPVRGKAICHLEDTYDAEKAPSWPLLVVQLRCLKSVVREHTPCWLKLVQKLAKPRLGC